jgi:hypothetical protein
MPFRLVSVCERPLNAQLALTTVASLLINTQLQPPQVPRQLLLGRRLHVHHCLHPRWRRRRSCSGYPIPARADSHRRRRHSAAPLAFVLVRGAILVVCVVVPRRWDEPPPVHELMPPAHKHTRLREPEPSSAAGQACSTAANRVPRTGLGLRLPAAHACDRPVAAAVAGR